MDEAFEFLEKLIVSQQQLPTNYSKLSPHLLSIDELIDLNTSTVNPNIPLEGETCITQVDGLFVDQVVESIPSSVNPTLPLESELHATQVLYVTSDSSTHGAFHQFLFNPIQVMRFFILMEYIDRTSSFDGVH